MTKILLCPNCNEDLIATTLGDTPIWWCPECAYTDTPLKAEMQLWRDAYDRGFQR